MSYNLILPANIPQIIVIKKNGIVGRAGGMAKTTTKKKNAGEPEHTSGRRSTNHICTEWFSIYLCSNVVAVAISHISPVAVLPFYLSIGFGVKAISTGFRTTNIRNIDFCIHILYFAIHLSIYTTFTINTGTEGTNTPFGVAYPRRAHKSCFDRINVNVEIYIVLPTVKKKTYIFIYIYIQYE